MVNGNNNNVNDENEDDNDASIPATVVDFPAPVTPVTITSKIIPSSDDFLLNSSCR